MNRQRDADRRDGDETALAGRAQPDRLPTDQMQQIAPDRKQGDRRAGADSSNDRRDGRRQPHPLGRINSRRDAAGAHLHRLRGRMKYLQIAVYTIKPVDAFYGLFLVCNIV